MKDELIVIEFDSMTGIGSALETGDYIIGRCKNVHNLPFAFVSPLKAKNNIYFHLFGLVKILIC